MSESLRVLLVLGSSAGGVARHVGQIAQLLGADGMAVDVAGPAPARSIVSGIAAAAGSHELEITDRPKPGDLATWRRLRGLERQRDVVHAHGLRAGALAVLARRSLPRARRPRLVVTLHNLPVGGAGVQALSAALERVVCRGADVVLGVSGDLVERARRRGAHQAERALVPAAAPAPLALDRSAVRRDLGVAGDTDPLLVTIARLAPQKGLDLLLDTAALLRGRAGLRWVVAGDGPLGAALQARIDRERLPVRLLGRRSNVPDLLAAADVVVQTSVWEGQPLVVQEALALGCRIVATDVGGTAEVTGDAARLVPFDDAEALTAAIRALLDDTGLAAELAARARRRAAGLPGGREVLDQLRHVYALGGRGARQMRVG